MGLKAMGLGAMGFEAMGFRQVNKNIENRDMAIPYLLHMKYNS